ITPVAHQSADPYTDLHHITGRPHELPLQSRLTRWGHRPVDIGAIGSLHVPAVDGRVEHLIIGCPPAKWRRLGRPARLHDPIPTVVVPPNSHRWMVCSRARPKASQKCHPAHLLVVP